MLLAQSRSYTVHGPRAVCKSGAEEPRGDLPPRPASSGSGSSGGSCYAPAPAGPTSSLELRAARGRLAEDSAFILTNRSHPTALRRASVTERALYFTAAVQAVGASERDGAGAAGVAGRVHGFGATGGDTDLYGRLRVSIVGR